jgi:hypothetical protein
MLTQQHRLADTVHPRWLSRLPPQVLVVFVQDVAFKESIVICGALLTVSFVLHALAYRAGQCQVRGGRQGPAACSQLAHALDSMQLGSLLPPTQPPQPNRSAHTGVAQGSGADCADPFLCAHCASLPGHCADTEGHVHCAQVSLNESDSVACCGAHE